MNSINALVLFAFLGGASALIAIDNWKSLTSPDYPESMSPGQILTFRINAPSTYRIEVRILGMNLQNENRGEARPLFSYSSTRAIDQFTIVDRYRTTRRLFSMNSISVS